MSSSVRSAVRRAASPCSTNRLAAPYPASRPLASPPINEKHRAIAWTIRRRLLRACPPKIDLDHELTRLTFDYDFGGARSGTAPCHSIFDQDLSLPDSQTAVLTERGTPSAGFRIRRPLRACRSLFRTVLAAAAERELTHRSFDVKFKSGHLGKLVDIVGPDRASAKPHVGRGQVERLHQYADVLEDQGIGH